MSARAKARRRAARWVGLKLARALAEGVAMGAGDCPDLGKWIEWFDAEIARVLLGGCWTIEAPKTVVVGVDPGTDEGHRRCPRSTGVAL